VTFTIVGSAEIAGEKCKGVGSTVTFIVGLSSGKVGLNTGENAGLNVGLKLISGKLMSGIFKASSVGKLICGDMFACRPTDE